MPKDKIRLFFLFGVLAITLHFTIYLGVDIFRYFSYKGKVAGRITEWEIVKIKDRFAIKAEYEFEVKEKNWHGASTLKPPYFLNEIAALDALKNFAKMSWDVWYQPNQPNHSLLEKCFPVNLLFRTLICYGVLIYFLYLTKKVARV